MSEVGVGWEEEFGVALFFFVFFFFSKCQFSARGLGETHEVSDSPTWSDMSSQLGPYF